MHKDLQNNLRKCGTSSETERKQILGAINLEQQKQSSLLTQPQNSAFEEEMQQECNENQGEKEVEESSPLILIQSQGQQGYGESSNGLQHHDQRASASPNSSLLTSKNTTNMPQNTATEDENPNQNHHILVVGQESPHQNSLTTKIQNQEIEHRTSSNVDEVESEVRLPCGLCQEWQSLCQSQREDLCGKDLQILKLENLLRSERENAQKMQSEIMNLKNQLTNLTTLNQQNSQIITHQQSNHNAPPSIMSCYDSETRGHKKQTSQKVFASQKPHSRQTKSQLISELDLSNPYGGATMERQVLVAADGAVDENSSRATQLGAIGHKRYDSLALRDAYPTFDKPSRDGGRSTVSGQVEKHYRKTQIKNRRRLRMSSGGIGGVFGQAGGHHSSTSEALSFLENQNLPIPMPKPAANYEAVANSKNQSTSNESSSFQRSFLDDSQSFNMSNSVPNSKPESLKQSIFAESTQNNTNLNNQNATISADLKPLGRIELTLTEDTFTDESQTLLCDQFDSSKKLATFNNENLTLQLNPLLCPTPKGENQMQKTATFNGKTPTSMLQSSQKITNDYIQGPMVCEFDQNHNNQNDRFMHPLQLQKQESSSPRNRLTEINEENGGASEGSLLSGASGKQLLSETGEIDFGAINLCQDIKEARKEVAYESKKKYISGTENVNYDPEPCLGGRLTEGLSRISAKSKPVNGKQMKTLDLRRLEKPVHVVQDVRPHSSQNNQQKLQKIFPAASPNLRNFIAKKDVTKGITIKLEQRQEMPKAAEEDADEMWIPTKRHLGHDHQQQIHQQPLVTLRKDNTLNDGNSLANNSRFQVTPQALKFEPSARGTVLPSGFNSNRRDMSQKKALLDSIRIDRGKSSAVLQNLGKTGGSSSGFLFKEHQHQQSFNNSTTARMQNYPTTDRDKKIEKVGAGLAATQSSHSDKLLTGSSGEKQTDRAAGVHTSNNLVDPNNYSSSTTMSNVDQIQVVKKSRLARNLGGVMMAAAGQQQNQHQLSSNHNRNVPSFGLHANQTFGEDQTAIFGEYKLALQEANQELEMQLENRNLLSSASPLLSSQNRNRNGANGEENRTNERSVYKEFFVIGVQSEDIYGPTLNKSRNSITPGDCNGGAMNNEEPQTMMLEPQTLYTHIKQGDQEIEMCQRRKVVKEFCFPMGVEVTPISSIASLKTVISQVDNQQNFFAFTLNSSEDLMDIDKSRILNRSIDPLATSADIFSRTQDGLNCLCIQFTEIVVMGSPDQALDQIDEYLLDELIEEAQIYQTRRAYCLMFTNTLYQMHLNILSLILEMAKQSRRQIIGKVLRKTGNVQKDEIQRLCSELYAFNIIGQELPKIVKQALSSFYQEKVPMRLEQLNKISQSLGTEFIQMIRAEEFTLTASKFWFCPFLFKSIGSLSTFLALLNAIFIEKSIICYGKNLNMVSSLILGLESLLRPFKWTMALVPVLPEQLLDTIEAPFPLLAGITRENFEQVSQQLTPEEMQQRIWIDTDTGSIKWCEEFKSLLNSKQKMEKFNFLDLKARLQEDWRALQLAIQKQRNHMVFFQSQRRTSFLQQPLKQSSSQSVFQHPIVQGGIATNKIENSLQSTRKSNGAQTSLELVAPTTQRVSTLRQRGPSVLTNRSTDVDVSASLQITASQTQGSSGFTFRAQHSQASLGLGGVASSTTGGGANSSSRFRKSIESQNRIANQFWTDLPSEDVKEASRKVCETIRKVVRQNMLTKLADWTVSARSGKLMPPTIVQQLGVKLVDSSKNSNKGFLKEFVQSQMFTQYIEENCEIQRDVNNRQSIPYLEGDLVLDSLT